MAKQEVQSGVFWDEGRKNMMFTLTRPLIIYKNCHLHTPVTAYTPYPATVCLETYVFSAQASGFCLSLAQ